VFEAILTDAPQFGSVFGGGRYDDLVLRFLGERVPATGASIGVDRLLAALVHLGKIRLRKSTAEVLVTAIDPSLLSDYLAMTYELRRAGIPTELYLGSERGPGRQVKHADRCDIPIALVYGGDEKTRGVVALKDMAAGRQKSKDVADRESWRQTRPGQREVPRADLVSAVRELLAQIESD
jgi:histidyl-tRNA synthetase